MKEHRFQEEVLNCVDCYRNSIKNGDIIAGSGGLNKGIFRGWWGKKPDWTEFKRGILLDGGDIFSELLERVFYF